MTRFWLALARFAARRAGDYGVRRVATEEQWDAGLEAMAVEWAEASLPIALETWPTYPPPQMKPWIRPEVTTTWPGTATITQRYS